MPRSIHNGTELPVPASAADIAEGARRARILGCNGGCHGREGSHGGLIFETPDGSKLIAPDLHRLAAEYSAAELERVIRRGVKPDGTSVVDAIPSQMFYQVSDQHLGQVIVYLRSQPPGTEILPETWLGPMVRGMLFFIQHTRGWQPFAAGPLPGDDVLHRVPGDDLKGSTDGSTPDLAIAAAYSVESSAHLMKTGEPIGGRELKLMTLVAKERFANFTDQEVEALHAYLNDRATALAGAAAEASPNQAD